MKQILFKDKQKVSIFISNEDAKNFKKAAIDKGISLSDFLLAAGKKAMKKHWSDPPES